MELGEHNLEPTRPGPTDECGSPCMRAGNSLYDEQDKDANQVLA